MRGWGRLVGGVSIVLVGCSGGLTVANLPDRGDPEVQATEARLASVVERHNDLIGPDPDCDVRLLSEEGPVAYVWAECRSHGAVSLPLRVEGAKAEWPRDGTYADDLERLFPDELHDLLVEGGAAIRP